MSSGIAEACRYVANVLMPKAEAIIKAGGGRETLPQQSPPRGRANAADDVDYTVSFKGTCTYKFVNRDNFLPCDPTVTFTHFKDMISNFEFTANSWLFTHESPHFSTARIWAFFLPSVRE